MTERQILLFYRAACRREAQARKARIVDVNAAQNGGKAAIDLMKALDL